MTSPASSIQEPIAAIRHRLILYPKSAIHQLIALALIAALLPLAALAGPARQAFPVQTGSWTHSEVDDWLPGTFTGTFVEGSVLRLEDGVLQGEYISAPLQAPFGFNAGQLEWVASRNEGIAIDIRSSVDGQNWDAWRPARLTRHQQVYVSQLFVFRLFTSWLQYRVAFTTDSDSPLLDEIRIRYINSTTGPALADIVGRVPLPGPATLTPTPEAIARAEWAGVATPPATERQQPRRVELAQVLAPVDDPNPPATLRALRAVETPWIGATELPYHYLIDGQGNIYEGWGSPTRRLPNADAGTVRLAVLADAEAEGVSEAAQARLIDVLAWLASSYRLPDDAIAGAPDAPERLAALVAELQPAVARAMVRSRTLFAEGSTQNATERLALFNPGATEAQATLTAFAPAGEERRTIVVPAGQRVDLTLNNVLPEMAAVGLDLQADRPLLAERTMIVGRELLSSAGTTTLARAWYFAAGVTAEDAQTYLLIVNPQRQDVAAVLTIYPDGTTPTTREVTLPPRSRTTLRLNDLVPDARFGLKLVASQPVAAERSVYLPSGAAHLATGIEHLSRRWWFAEGSTTDGVTTTLQLLNPWPQQIAATLQVMSEDGTSLTRRYAIPAEARLVLTLNDVVPALPFAMQVEAERPIAAERLMLLDNGASATATAGATAPATRWTFVEGSTAATAEQFLLIANPNRASVGLELTYVLADGTREQRTETAPGMSRFTIFVNEHLPDQPILTTIITAERPIIAERSIFVPGANGRGAETSVGIAGK